MTAKGGLRIETEGPTHLHTARASKKGRCHTPAEGDLHKVGDPNMDAKRGRCHTLAERIHTVEGPHPNRR